MILFLGVSTSADEYQPITVPDDYPISALAPLLPGVWWEPTAPVWAASDSEELARAASSIFGGLATYRLGADGFPIAPDGR